MDLKQKITQWVEKTKEFWGGLCVKCGPAIEKGRELWSKALVWLGKAGEWCLRTWEWLKERGRWLAGNAAVLALKSRKWVRKRTAGIRSWWARWKGRAWLEERAVQIRGWIEAVREKLPAPQEPEAEPEVPEAQPVQSVVQPQPAVIRPEPAVVRPEPPVAEPVRPVRKAPAKPLVDPNSPLGKVLAVLRVIGGCIKRICLFIFKIRKFIMAAPVVYVAVKMAILNSNRLPDMVGMDIQASGEFARMVSRSSAVMGPLALTGFCLVLLFCSRKTLLPWMISIFTLILPVLIWMTNYYA